MKHRSKKKTLLAWNDDGNANCLMLLDVSTQYKMSAEENMHQNEICVLFLADNK